MKNTLSFFLILVIALSCREESLAPTNPIDDMTDPDAVLKLSGSFNNGPYGTVTGTAQVFRNTDNTFDLKLNMFSTNNGPDLYVYLSKEAMPIEFISLGKLKSTNGNQLYTIPGSPDFTQYTYISIHCQAYNHLFGSALLAK